MKVYKPLSEVRQQEIIITRLFDRMLCSVICHGWWPLQPYANVQFQLWICIIRLAFIFCKVKCFWKHHNYTCFVIQGQFVCCTSHERQNNTSLQNNLFWPQTVPMLVCTVVYFFRDCSEIDWFKFDRQDYWLSCPICGLKKCEKQHVSWATN